MYYQINSYKLADKELIALGTEEKRFKYEAFILGDYIVSFGLSLKKGGLTGEMCLHGGGTPAYIFDFVGNEVYTRYKKQRVAALGAEKTAFSIMYSVKRRRFDIYVDGVLAAEDYCADSGIPINFDKLTDFYISVGSNTGEAELELTELRAHSTAARVDGAVVYDPDNVYPLEEKKVVLTGKNYFPSEDESKAMLADALCVHMRSGVIFRDGKKLLSEHSPYYSDDGMMVSLSDLCAVLSDAERDSIRPLPKYGRDGDEYVSLSDVASALGRRMYYDDSTVHYGMTVLTTGEFIPPNDNKDLQKLNDFLFYFRPDKERLLADYKASRLAGVHPRILATADDFDRIKEQIRTNEHKARWFGQLIEYCDSLKDKPTVRYELRDGVRLLYVSWDLQHYAMALALAYKLTGDRKYLDYALPHLLAAAEMPDWNPSHHIDVGTLALGYAVAYDWFYDDLTEEQRRIMEKGAYKNVFYTVNRAVEDRNTPYCNILMSNNHNVFCNAGVMATCVAFMDVYPEIASKIGADVFRVLEAFLDKFAPMGAYYEGPYYAETAIDYTVRVLASVKPTFGTLYCLDKAQGLDRMGDYMMLMQSDVAPFNFADSNNKEKLLSTGGLFWLFDHYGTKGFKDDLASRNFKKPSVEAALQALLWYNVSDEGGSGSAKTVVRYPEEEIITMRDSYRSGQTFVGIKAGNTVYAHSHLDAGSFVLDSMGRRWAYDLGQDNYNLYYKYQHWDVYRLRAEAHNTLIINPDRSPGYVLGSRADVVEFVETEDKVKAVIRMTDLYGAERGVESARRGYLFTDSRSSLVIRDEVKLTRPSLLRWHMCTTADIEVDGNLAILRDRDDPGKYITVEFAASCGVKVGCERALPLPTSPDVPGQNENEGFYRLYCIAESDGGVTITAKINTRGDGATPIGDYDVSIDDWSV